MRVSDRRGDLGKVQDETEGMENQSEVWSSRKGISHDVVLALDVDNAGKVVLCQHFLPQSQSR